MKTVEVIDHIVEWLNAYCEKSKLEGFIVGVSGGIDSAVTSTLCAKTGKKVILVNMPIHQAPEQFSLSVDHISWLEKNFTNVESAEIELTHTLKALENSLPEDIQDGLTMANTRARLRMLTLYAFAAHNKMLVAGTGNKVEDFGVGFYTKYGDGGVDLSPIADLMKSEVRALGMKLGVMYKIIKAQPTDGLWGDDRTDESQLGATYDELEWAMQFEASDGNKSGLDKRQMEVLTIYRKFNRANRHKMEPIPVCKIPEYLKN